MSYIRLKDGDNYLYPEMYGIDTTNVIATITNKSDTYTAIQDCYIAGYIASSTGDRQIGLLIDGVLISSGYSSAALRIGINIFVKKNQVITLSGTANTPNLTIYGLKYHS